MQHSIEDKISGRGSLRQITVSLRRKFVVRQGVTMNPTEVYKLVHRLRLRRIQHSIEDKITGSLRR